MKTPSKSLTSMQHKIRHPVMMRKFVGGKTRTMGMKRAFVGGKTRWVMMPSMRGAYMGSGVAVRVPPGQTSHSNAVKGSLFRDNQVMGSGKVNKGALQHELQKAFMSYKSHPVRGSGRRHHKGGMVGYA